MRRGWRGQRRELVAGLGLVLLSLVACRAILTPVPTPTGSVVTATAVKVVAPTVVPAAYLTPIPPTPTFTPSPTPTPVIHIVARGDTLFGIALEYGVTVDALVRANGLDVDDYLHVGQALIIPLEEEESGGGELQAPMDRVILPTPTPMPLTVQGVALYETPLGGVVCMGEIVNSVDVPATNLQVEVTLVGPDTTPLLSGRVLVAADYLAPRSRAPFGLLFEAPPDGVSDVQVRLVRGEAVGPITAAFTPLVVVQPEGGISGPQYRVRGSVLNRSEHSVSRVSVVVTVYDAEAKVIGYRQLVMSDTVVLAPGEQHAFEVLLTPQGVEPPSDFGVIAWGTVKS